MFCRKFSSTWISAASGVSCEAGHDDLLAYDDTPVPDLAGADPHDFGYKPTI
jgi:hypothetical protein